MGDSIRVLNINGITHYEDADGFRVAAIAGGSDNGVSVTDQVQGALDNAAGTGQSSETSGSQEEGEVPTEPTQQQQSPVEPGSSDSLAGDFLKGIPVHERPIVEKYIKDWDAGVTKKFQSIHDQYSPYKQLGDPDQLAQAKQLMELVQTNPEHVYQTLQQYFGQQQQAQPGQKEQPVEEAGEPSEFEAQFTPYKEKIENQQQMLETLAQIVLGTQQQTQQAQEDQQLEQYLDGLKETHGEFDEGYVLSQMAAGKTGEEAVQNFQKLVNAQVQRAQQAGAGVPPVLSGGGTAPTQQTQVTELGDKDVKALVASLIKNQE